MSKTNTCENNLLKLLFNNTTWANIGDATGIVGSSTAGSFYASLHTADPGEAGDQTTNEISYGSYARVAIARSSAGFTVSNNQVSNTAQTQWPSCTSGTPTATHFGIGRASSGAGELLYSGALSDSLAISSGIQPTAAAGALVNTED